VRSLLGILTRNAPLKVGAVLLASVLYAGLVFSQNVRVWPGPIPIEPFGQASDIFLLDVSPQAVTNIRFVAAGGAASSVSGQSFRATVDLRGLKPSPDGAPLTAPVLVEALEPEVQVTGWTPTFVSVTLDAVTTRSVPIRVDRGAVPEGLSAGEPEVDAQVATVRGPASVVGRVVAAVARVIIDASGVDVDQDVDLVAVDARGDRLSPVDFDPPRVHVRIAVSVSGTTRTVPVVPILRGVPAVGYAVAGVRVQPVSVLISGPRATLQEIDHLDTTAVSVAGVRADVASDAELVLPDGVTVEGGSATARVTVSIVPITGSNTYAVAVVLVGTSDAFTYSLSSGSTLVVVSGPLTALNGLVGSTLQAVADVTGLGAGTHTLTLRVAVPSGLAVKSVSPAQVTVTISSAPSPTPTPTATP
jgi:YbbR domain-containing protein